MKYTTEDLNGQTVLITGGAGFIGSNLALHIQEHYPRARVVVFDGFVLGNFRNLRGFRGECVAGDISNPADLSRLTSYHFDYILHQAAISDTTVTDQARMVRVNTNSLPDLVELAVRTGAKSLVYASSAGVYGNSPAPNRVGHGEEPTNVYGFSKLMMDHAASSLATSAELRIVGLRYFNVYGPREEFKGTTASMILQLARQMLAGQRPRLFKSGEQRRDFVYIEDVIQANLRAISAPSNGVFNVGSGEAREFNELLAILARELGADCGVEYIDNPWSFYQNHTEADIAATRAAIGYEPRFSLEDGIRAYLPEILRLCRPEVELCSI